jgi:hypothetical protein
MEGLAGRSQEVLRSVWLRQMVETGESVGIGAKRKTTPTLSSSEPLKLES